MPQMLLFADPRPLVERLGADFFRQAPERPGVYLMRDAADAVLYIGKAKNLRKRLASYRVANPDRMRRRHLRLLRAVQRIELEECADELSALAREAALLRSLRPRFNRAGVWPGPPRFFCWKIAEPGLLLAVAATVEPGWQGHGPRGAGLFPLRAALLRLLWCCLHPERGLAGMPEGWFRGRHAEVAALPNYEAPPAVLDDCAVRLGDLCHGQAEGFAEWIHEQTALQTQPFEIAVREADLETVMNFSATASSRLLPTLDETIAARTDARTEQGGR